MEKQAKAQKIFSVIFVKMMRVKPIPLRLEYSNKAYEPGVKEKIIEMAINGSGMRDTSRVLGIHKETVMNQIKKKENSLV